MPYRSRGNRCNSVQFGVGRSIWSGSPPPAIPEQVLDGIPGFLAWLSLLLIVACAVIFPRVAVAIAGVLAFYTAVRFVIGAWANFMGLRRIRQWEQERQLPRIPVMAVTANAMPEDREACRASGMDDFVPKPFKAEALQRVLARWLVSSEP